MEILRIKEKSKNDFIDKNSLHSYKNRFRYDTKL